MRDPEDVPEYPRSEEEHEMLQRDVERLYTLYAKARAEGRTDRIARLNWQIDELEEKLGQREERCEFCGQFMRPDGKDHGACLREYERSVNPNG